jgi:putative tricarboxylic transport membrane protein
MLGRYAPLAALVPPALLIFYVLAVDSLGFLPTAAIMVLACALALGASWRLALGLALLAPPAVHLAFYKLLRVPLPDGLLTAPWA